MLDREERSKICGPSKGRSIHDLTGREIDLLHAPKSSIEPESCTPESKSGTPELIESKAIDCYQLLCTHKLLGESNSLHSILFDERFSSFRFELLMHWEVANRHAFLLRKGATVKERLKKESQMSKSFIERVNWYSIAVDSVPQSMGDQPRKARCPVAHSTQ